MVLPQRGLTVEFVGCPQAKQPTTRKVGIGPALMIKAPSRTRATATPTQDRAQAQAHPPVDEDVVDVCLRLEGVAVGLEQVVLSGVAEGWRVADKIAEAGIPCLVGPMLSNPTRQSDRYDKAYANIGLMHKAGVKVAIRTGDSENVRNLPYNAGFAAAYGLGKEEALRAVTITPAEIFGVSDEIGSLEVGKKATLFVADGDPFETKTDIHHVFIDGYMVPMESRHTRLRPAQRPVRLSAHLRAFLAAADVDVD